MVELRVVECLSPISDVWCDPGRCEVHCAVLASMPKLRFPYPRRVFSGIDCSGHVVNQDHRLIGTVIAALEITKAVLLAVINTWYMSET